MTCSIGHRKCGTWSKEVVKKAITPVTGVEDHAALYGCLMPVSLLSIAELLLYRKRTIG